MTGEITLTGQVLPIGGLKEKALAAQRNGIATVIAPTLNEADVDEIPEHLRRAPRVPSSSRRSARCSRPRSERRRERAAAARVRYRSEPDNRPRRGRGMAARRRRRLRPPGRCSGSEQPVRPARDRGRRAARQRARGLRSAREAYARLHNGKAPPKMLLDDKKFHKDLRTRRRRSGTPARAARGPEAQAQGRLRPQAAVPASSARGIALAVSEDLRNKVSTRCSARGGVRLHLDHRAAERRRVADADRLRADARPSCLVEGAPLGRPLS